MAADDDRNAGELSSGDENKVGVEIESVDNFDAVLPKIATEIEARAQRAPSEEATTEGKLRRFREVMSQRAAAADAAQICLKIRGNEILGEDGELAFGPSRLEGIDHQKEVDGCMSQRGQRT
jgi:hypothetical protein